MARNWSNKGLHVNMDAGGGPGSMNAKIGEGKKLSPILLVRGSAADALQIADLGSAATRLHQDSACLRQDLGEPGVLAHRERSRRFHKAQDRNVRFDFEHECVARPKADPARAPIATATTREPVRCRRANFLKPVKASPKS